MRLIFANKEEIILEPDKLIERLILLQNDITNQGFIFQMYVNGHYFDQDISFLKTAFAEIEDIHVEAKKPIELVLEGCVDAVNYFPNLVQGLTKASQHFHDNKENEGISLFQQALEGLAWFQTIVVGLSQYIDQQILDNAMEGSFNELVEKYNSMLNELLEAWENYDIMLIGDLLEYEMVPLLQEWYEVTLNILKSFQD